MKNSANKILKLFVGAGALASFLFIVHQMKKERPPPPEFCITGTLEIRQTKPSGPVQQFPLTCTDQADVLPPLLPGTYAAVYRNLRCFQNGVETRCSVNEPVTFAVSKGMTEHISPTFTLYVEDDNSLTLTDPTE